MDREATERTRRLLGEDAMRRVESARVLVMGLGGVGSWCAEALARAGVGALGLLDRDVVARSNLNRQLCALVSTVGRRKTDVVRERLLDVNPDLRVAVYDVSYGPETADSVPLGAWDFVVDAIDQVSAKVLLAVRAREAGVRLVSAMGGGNKLDATRFRAADLSKTDRCPLAAVMRKKLRRLGIAHGTVVFSDEEPRVPFSSGGEGRHVAPGTLPTVVGAEGLVLAQTVLAAIAGPPAAPRVCEARDRVRRRRGGSVVV